MLRLLSFGCRAMEFFQPSIIDRLRGTDFRNGVYIRQGSVLRRHARLAHKLRSSGSAETLVNLKIFALALAGLAFVAVIAVKAENGVSADSASFDPAAGPEGPGVALGRGTPQGLEAAFAEQNGAGDVHTRKLVLKSVDDGFEPS